VKSPSSQIIPSGPASTVGSSPIVRTSWSVAFVKQGKTATEFSVSVATPAVISAAEGK